jgi:hypothetical protein
MTILTAPIIGDMEFEDDHAKRILEKENNGGWELKKAKASDSTGDKGNTKKSEK